MPSMSTISYWMQGTPESQWYTQSQIMAQHTKAGSFERRFAIVMNENFRLTSDFETYVPFHVLYKDRLKILDSHVYNTQLMQSEAVSFAYRSWRREWRGKGREYVRLVITPLLQASDRMWTTSSRMREFWFGK